MSFHVRLAAQDEAPAPLRAALCELELWKADSRAERNALMLRKADCLVEAGEYSRAFETLSGIPQFGLSEAERRHLAIRRLVCSYSAGDYTSFRGLLDEALALGTLDSAATEKIRDYLSSARIRHRSEDAAMLLSIIPGIGHAYSGDLAGAGKYCLLQTGALALGAGALLQKLYAAAFAGGGMLLYSVLPDASADAMRAARDFNAVAERDYYAPVVELLRECK